MPGSCRSSTTRSYLGGSSASCAIADSPSMCASTQKPSLSKSCCMAARAILQSSTIRMRFRRVGDICDAPSAAGSSEGTGGMSGSEVSSSLGIHFCSMCRNAASETGLQSASCIPHEARSIEPASAEQAMKMVCACLATRSETVSAVVLRPPMCCQYAFARSVPERPGSRRSASTMSHAVVEQSTHASSAVPASVTSNASGGSPKDSAPCVIFAKRCCSTVTENGSSSTTNTRMVR
mmetsp:Transcript_22371/g.66931  ORF Transcript_22371/g.66931 Transcript_22371/m.66931 type:complete len:236 (+) Transcript_22371:548-1255(+)